MWVNHHKMFNHIRRTDDAFLFLNGLLLLFITFVPFPTSLVADYLRHAEARTAALLYIGTYEALAIAFNLLWSYASAKKRLLAPDADEVQVRAIARQYATGPLSYVVAFGLAFISVGASLMLCLQLAVYFALTGCLPVFRHRAAP